MNMKKPAQLGENLLSIRPRKGEARPQSEQEAHKAEAPVPQTVEPAPKQTSTTEKTTPRRRRRLSDKKMQLNLRVSEKSLERFTKLADGEGLIFGDLFEKMLDSYEKKR
jgi:predicted DNA binding CopG/RHH family protein